VAVTGDKWRVNGGFTRHLSPVTPREWGGSFGGGELMAMGVNPGLAFGMPEGMLQLFLEQGREHEQRIKRHPGQRGGLVGGAADGRIQFGPGRGEEGFREQPVFKPLELGFLGGPEWGRGRGPHFEARFRAEIGP